MFAQTITHVPLFTFNGDSFGDAFGYSVSGAGDVNGDGVADVIIGAAYADPNGSNSGESYVVFGGSGVGVGGTIELSDLDGSDGFVVNGIDSGDFPATQSVVREISTETVLMI